MASGTVGSGKSTKIKTTTNAIARIAAKARATYKIVRRTFFTWAYLSPSCSRCQNCENPRAYFGSPTRVMTPFPVKKAYQESRHEASNRKGKGSKRKQKGRGYLLPRLGYSLKPTSRSKNPVPFASPVLCSI